ncbi:TetR/AcrR family transcriptional regulator [Streptomyces spectabilis]|uniref:AcrR family transcriptional regulator n=1 Tax=Streptomyces spectabilis TaxID=68270 RepID=A0A5P2X6S8_STRST|nr:TetR/AcrR family transcriptional regulator [Streptomyces spectabilis]MBB5101373.1 AcrR family transcriptional regulator [Streptomyces spectabilis]MCI3900569.1 TetR/AcrR family transcriptional regulator [Streptomyces spectabilis]QEV58132.1 TetR/AcrR family transcriptional regulator [Streptomyces spectabilis]GGV10970.1 TetR family transcriptional regulator [Streptomyces spectabilis]
MSSKDEGAADSARRRAGRTGADGSAPERPPAPRPGGRPRDPAIEEAILRATRARLATDGYARLTIGDVVADAGVTRPTLYRRWANKYELVVDALHYGLRKQREAYPPLDMERMTPLEAFTEAVRRLDPRYHNERAMALHGNFMGEAEREPELFEQMRVHGNEPRCAELAHTLRRLQDVGAVRADADLDAVVTLCFGSYFGDYLRTGRATPDDLADRVVAMLWPTVRAQERPAP